MHPLPPLTVGRMRVHLCWQGSLERPTLPNINKARHFSRIQLAAQETQHTHTHTRLILIRNLRTFVFYETHHTRESLRALRSVETSSRGRQAHLQAVAVTVALFAPGRNYPALSQLKSWQTLWVERPLAMSHIFQGLVGMEKRIALPLRKLTKRVTDTLGRTESVVSISIPVIMAEAEEDFSSLPLPDRFQHKVGIAV